MQLWMSTPGGGSSGTFPQTITKVTHDWLDSYDSLTGLFTQSQPSYTDLSGLPQLAQTKALTAHQWLDSYSAVTGLFTASQPSYSDLSGAVPTAPAVGLAVHQVGHGFATGQVLYFNGSVWALAQSNAIGTLGLGVITVSGLDDFIVFQVGLVSGMAGLTAGQYYFVSDAVAGALTATEPTAHTSFSNPLFFALSTTTGLVLPFRPSQIDPFSQRIVSKATNYTAVAGDIVLCDTSAGGFTVTLPLSVSNAAETVVVKKISSDGNTLTLAASGSDTIDGSATQSLIVPNTAVQVVADGSLTWDII